MVGLDWWTLKGRKSSRVVRMVVSIEVMSSSDPLGKTRFQRKGSVGLT